MKRKSKEYYYSLGGIAMLVGLLMIIEPSVDMMKKYPNGVMPGGDPTGFVWAISVIAGIVCIAAGGVYIYKGKNT